MTVNSASKDSLSSSQYYILTASFFLGSMSLSSRFNLAQRIIPPRLLSSLQIVQRYKSQTVKKSFCCSPEMHFFTKWLFLPVRVIQSTKQVKGHKKYSRDA